MKVSKVNRYHEIIAESWISSFQHHYFSHQLESESKRIWAKELCVNSTSLSTHHSYHWRCNRVVEPKRRGIRFISPNHRQIDEYSHWMPHKTGSDPSRTMEKTKSELLWSEGRKASQRIGMLPMNAGEHSYFDETDKNKMSKRNKHITNNNITCFIDSPYKILWWWKKIRALRRKFCWRLKKAKT